MCLPEQERNARVHNSRALNCVPFRLMFVGPVFGSSCHPCGAQNLEVAPRFLQDTRISDFIYHGATLDGTGSCKRLLLSLIYSTLYD